LLRAGTRDGDPGNLAGLPSFNDRAARFDLSGAEVGHSPAVGAPNDVGRNSFNPRDLGHTLRQLRPGERLNPLADLGSRCDPRTPLDIVGHILRGRVSPSRISLETAHDHAVE
jgi:hypothetical protein